VTTGLMFDNGRPLTQTAVDLTIPPHNVAVSGYPPMTLLMSGDLTITTAAPGPPPGQPNPQPNPQPGPIAPALQLASPDALVRRNRAIVDLVCAAGGPCPGDLLLQNQPAAGARAEVRPELSDAGASASVATARRRAKLVTYGKASFNLAAGQTSMITVKLKGPGRRITLGHHTPTVWANIRLSGGQPISQQVTLVH